MGSLSGNGTIDTVAGGTPTLTVGNNNASSTFGGTIQNSAGALALQKTGSGTLDLSGANTYTGATTISNGTLVLDQARATRAGRHGRQRQRRRRFGRQRQRLHRRGRQPDRCRRRIAASQGVVDLRDGTINTFTVNGNLALGNASGGSVLDFELGGSGVDQINAASVALVRHQYDQPEFLGILPERQFLPADYRQRRHAECQPVPTRRRAGRLCHVRTCRFGGQQPVGAQYHGKRQTPGTAYWTGQGSLLTSDSANYWNSGGTSGVEQLGAELQRQQ